MSIQAVRATAKTLFGGPTRIGVMMPAIAASTAPARDDASQRCSTAVGVGGISATSSKRRRNFSRGLLLIVNN